MKKIIAALLLLFSVLSYADQPIEIIVPFSPGGATDVFARATQKYLITHLNNPDIFVMNKPGADGRIGARYALQKPADGSSIVVVSTGTFLYAKVLYNDLGYDYSDFDIIAPITTSPASLIVSNKSGVNTLDEFISLSKRKKLNCGSSSSASTFVGQYLISKLKLQNIEIVSYKGSNQVLMDLIGGHLDCAIEPVAIYIPAIKGNLIRVIATASDHHPANLPGVPLFKETVPGFVFSNWYGMGILKNTPESKKAKLLDALRRMVNNPEFIRDIAVTNLELIQPRSSAQEYIENEYIKMTAIGQSLNIKKTD